ncbi:MAG: 2-C-methyl-D-erythritol 4-phosphate cytidylyltransferase, partial [Clostridia bacterium]|nr:2-C-methyl-D-erythritol 4-phosphate cytidylyltransferase [Clostridia bacterium]
VPRDLTVSAATPQIFSREIYERIIREFYGSFSAFTDDSSMAEKLGIKVKAVICDDTNIKITSPSDILIANAIYAERM